MSVQRAKHEALLYWAALLTAAAAIIHLSGVWEQWPLSVPLSVLFLIGAVIQFAAAVAVVALPTRRIFSLVALLNLAAALLWVFSHAVGLPLITTLWQPEMLSIFDLLLAPMELLAALLLLYLAERPSLTKPLRAWRTAAGVVAAFILVSSLTWLGSSAAANAVWLPTGTSVSVPAGQTATLTYCNLPGSPLAMDLSEPAASAHRPAPTVLFIHGGAGIMGSRQLLVGGGTSGPYWVTVYDTLVKRGFVAGSIDYGLWPLHSAQDMIKDAKCAVRFLRAHASELGIDVQRIGVAGESQGGYLGAMLGTAGPSAGFDVGQYLDQSSGVQAVADISGFSDLLNMTGGASWTSSLMGEFGDSKAALQAASPITYVAPGDPPFLIIHGTEDPILAPHHAQEIYDRLKAANVPATLVMVQHGGHGLYWPPTDQPQQPGPDALVQMIGDLFVKTLMP